MGVHFTVDAKALGKSIISSASRQNSQSTVLNSLYIGRKPLKRRFEELKQEMVKDFLAHPVTKEIMSGPSASNVSGTLRGYGNLFSFIGFTKGSKPIQPIVDLLQQTHLNVTKIDRRGRITIRVTLPGRDDIFSVTPMPWATGLSWAQRIEQGMPGFGEYLNKRSISNSSRSSTGVQSKNDVREGGFSNTSYISSFIKKWQKKFSRMDKQ